MKKSSDSLSSGDQVLAAIGFAGKSNNYKKKNKKSKNRGTRVYNLCDEESHMIKDYASLKEMKGAAQWR